MSKDRGEKTVRFAAPSDGWTAVPNQLLVDVELSRDARLTFALLSMYAWQEESAWPGQERVAAQLNTTDRTFRRYAAELAAADVLTIVRRGGMQTNRYVLHPERKYTSSHDRTPTSGHDRTAASYEEDTGRKTPSSVEADASTSRPAGKEIEERAKRLCRFLTEAGGGDPSEKRYDAKQLAAAKFLLERRDAATLKAVVEWAHTRTYWAPKVLKATTLRRWWDELLADYRAASKPKQSQGMGAFVKGGANGLGRRLEGHA